MRCPRRPLLAIRAAGTTAGLALLVGCQPAGTAPDGDLRAPAADAGQSGAPREAAAIPDPRSVAMPAHQIAAELEPLGLDRSGILVPPASGRAGWYVDGPEPGEPGAAVIAGHVDSATGPDVFASLSQAAPGDLVVVELEDGTALRFRVTKVRQFPQNRFPTSQVYANGSRPLLRLITCAGAYDHTARRYLDNLVVFAVPDQAKARPR